MFSQNSLKLSKLSFTSDTSSVPDFNIEEESLEDLNKRLECILSSHEERILHKPILAHKIKPKNLMGAFQKQWRYLLFTNRKLYTLDPKAYDKKIINKKELIKNHIDIEFLSHLIFFPDFVFDSYEILDGKKIKSLNPHIAEEFKGKPVDLIIGFEQKNAFNEADIALSVSMYVLLQIIHACQLVFMHDEEQDFKESLRKQDQIRSSARISKNRSSVLKSQVQYFPVYIVKNYQIQAGGKILELKNELKQYYRAKDSESEIKIGKQPDILKKVDTEYYAQLYWNLEPDQLPPLIKWQQEQEEQKILYEQSLAKKQALIEVDLDKQSVIDDMNDRDKITSYVSQNSSILEDRKKSIQSLMTVFILDHIEQYRNYLSLHASLKRDFEDGKFKLYSPYIFQNQIQIPFRNGEYIFIGSKISRILTKESHEKIAALVKESSTIFDKKLVGIFPLNSQPKVFLREFVDKIEANGATSYLNQSYIHQEQRQQLVHRIYFGYLIPKYHKVYPIDVNVLSTTIGFKHGLMLLSQFIDFVCRINTNDMSFGHLDFQNIYFIWTNKKTNQMKSKAIKSQKPLQKQAHSVQLLFIDRNLQNLTISADRHFKISQTTKENQEQFTTQILGDPLVNDSSSNEFSSDITSIKIFVQTIVQYCLRFSNYQSKSKQGKSYSHLNTHEEQMRQEYKAKVYDTLKDLLNQNDVIVEESENSIVDPDFEKHFFKKNFVAKLKTLKDVTAKYIQKFEDSKYWADVDKKNRKKSKSPTAPQVDKEFDKMNVSTFTARELNNMQVSEGDASILTFDKNQQYRSEPKKIAHHPFKQQRTVDVRLQVENMDGSIIEDDRDLEELMNMSMVTDRQNNLMLTSMASSIVSSCVSELAKKKGDDFDNLRPMSAISAVSSLNQRTEFNREELKELGHYTSQQQTDRTDFSKVDSLQSNDDFMDRAETPNVERAQTPCQFELTVVNNKEDDNVLRQPSLNQDSLMMPSLQALSLELSMDSTMGKRFNQNRSPNQRSPNANKIGAGKFQVQPSPAQKDTECSTTRFDLTQLSNRNLDYTQVSQSVAINPQSFYAVESESAEEGAMGDPQSQRAGNQGDTPRYH